MGQWQGGMATQPHTWRPPRMSNSPNVTLPQRAALFACSLFAAVCATWRREEQRVGAGTVQILGTLRLHGRPR